jgi:hypothetical protein
MFTEDAFSNRWGMHLWTPGFSGRVERNEKGIHHQTHGKIHLPIVGSSNCWSQTYNSSRSTTLCFFAASSSSSMSTVWIAYSLYHWVFSRLLNTWYYTIHTHLWSGTRLQMARHFVFPSLNIHRRFLVLDQRLRKPLTWKFVGIKWARLCYMPHRSFYAPVT